MKNNMGYLATTFFTFVAKVATVNFKSLKMAKILES